MKDALPCNPESLKLRPEWVLTAELREKALARRHLSRHTDLLSKSRPLKPLELGNVVQVQNQRGQHANKWDLSGTVLEVQGFDSYLIKMDGTGRVTKRRRRFLRPIVPFKHQQDNQLPLQRFNNELNRDGAANTSKSANTHKNHPNLTISTSSNTGPTADSQEASSSLLPSQPHTGLETMVRRGWPAASRSC